MTGRGFNNIPDDALGVLAYSNTAPAENINTERDDWLYLMDEKTPTKLVLRQKISGTHGIQTYLGAIVSQDRQTIYWVNETTPLH